MLSLRHEKPLYGRIHWPEAILMSSILIAVVALIIGAGHPQTNTPFPRLIGYDCPGAGGPLYANEEDDFPPHCRSIELNQ